MYSKFLPEILEDFVPLTQKQMKNASDTQRIHTCKKVIIDFINKKPLTQEQKKIADLMLDILQYEITTYIHLALIAPYFRQEKNDRKIYVFQKDFFDKFKRINFTRLQFKHIPKNMCGFVELPETLNDGRDDIKGFFFFCGPKKEIVTEHFIAHQDRDYPVSDNVICFSYTDQQNKMSAFHWTPVPQNENLTIKDCLIDVPYMEIKPETIDDELTLGIDVGKTDYPYYLACMYNLLAYLNTGDPDLRVFKNNIRHQSATSKTPIKADKHLSPANIVEVGFSYKKERLQHTDEWQVMPFMRWQHVGDGVKLVYVSGHTRRWRT